MRMKKVQSCPYCLDSLDVIIAHTKLLQSYMTGIATEVINLYIITLVGKWADPGGTAMPGQPVTRPEQAPEPHPLAKISLISKGAHGPRIRY
jgi:hypothetical protein